LSINRHKRLFSVINWKNDAASAVNSFAKENFISKRPFRLPLHRRLITLPIPPQKKWG
jgi:hypothetical protein